MPRTMSGPFRHHRIRGVFLRLDPREKSMSFRSASLLACALASSLAAPFALASPPQKPPVVHVDPASEKLPPERVKATVEAYKR